MFIMADECVWRHLYPRSISPFVYACPRSVRHDYGVCCVAGGHGTFVVGLGVNDLTVAMLVKPWAYFSLLVVPNVDLVESE